MYIIMIKKIYVILVVILLMPSIGISETTVTNKNFKLSEIATNLNEPWGMTFIDDNNLFITEKTGDIIQIDMSTGKKFSIDHELDFFIMVKVFIRYSLERWLCVCWLFEDREQGRSSLHQ